MKPILFNSNMVRAILDGRKIVTRRVVKPQREDWFFYKEDESYFGSNLEQRYKVKEPYHIGDVLYVRETFCELETDHVIDGVKYIYKADSTQISEQARKDFGYKWVPSIHMPCEAARIFLRVTDVCVERLQDIDDNGVVSEGLEIGAPFDELWDKTIKPTDRKLYGWNANPCVWVVKFERCEKYDEVRP